jgi:predicted extracellular nuclease
MRHILTFLLLLTLGQLKGQADSSALFPGFDDSPRGNKGVRIAFYNVENLFDTEHDSLKRDWDFTPEGNHHWTKYRYWEKQKKLAKVISAVGGWEPPEIVGLAEVENLHVLINLVHNTNLKKHHYQIIHHESPDRRGIDVAMIYRPDKVEIIEERTIAVNFPFNPKSKTRDILYVKAVLLFEDTVNIFINHWPSRWGGQFKTEPKRMYVAKLLKHYTDSIMKASPCSKVLILGDMNDAPSNKSLSESLEVKPPGEYTRYGLIDLMIPYEQQGTGTHYHRGKTGGSWAVLDHIIVSRSMLWDCKGAMIKDSRAYIFRAPFLLEKNADNQLIPNRSYLGMKYHGGFSDHLPVYVDVYLKN